MNCPQCGSSAPAEAGRCPVCGRKSTPQAIATSVLTPTPPGSDSETALALPFDSDVTHLASPTGMRDASGHTPLPSATSLTVGQNFGPRYHIIRLLGVGGMGSVYQGWDRELEVAVAVKVIRPDVTADPMLAQDLERRFKRELLLARQVTDKHVVRIHDIGEINGIKYITMPYIHGSDLASILRREGRLPLNRALSIAKQVATGLVAAHDAGVVHRDLKPANIMVDENDHAVIMDFGIARSTSSSTSVNMTVGAQVIGTVEYMAPEQAKAEAVDQRADLYAFGLILRDMLLGGRHAGVTSGVTELMSRMQTPPPGLRSIDPAIPEGVEALVTRCLAPDPAARYQTARELIGDIDRVAVGETPALSRRDAAAPGGDSGRLCLLALGLGAWLLRDKWSSATATATSAGRTCGDARDPAVQKCLWRSDARFSRIEPQPGAEYHARPVVFRPYRSAGSVGLSPSRSPDHVECDARSSATRQCGQLHERAARALGVGHAVREYDSTERDPEDLDREETSSLSTAAPNESGLIPRSGCWPIRCARSWRADLPTFSQSSSPHPGSRRPIGSRRSVYNDGVQADPAGHPPGGIEEFPEGDD